MIKYRFGMLEIRDNLYVSVFSFFALIFFILSQGLIYSSIFILAATLHELSHIFFLLRYGAKISRVTVFPFGVDIAADTSRISYKKELICTLAGSLANLLFSLLGYLFLKCFPSSMLLFFILCNLFLGCMNLIPLSFFDGGRAIRLILYDNFDIDLAYYIQRALDFFAALAFLCFSLFVVAGSDYNLSVVCVIIYAAISTLSAYIKTPCRKT